MTDPRYPIGPFHWAGSLSTSERQRMIDTIADTPHRLKAAVDKLTEVQLDTPYRAGGWTVRQVVHHMPDSHLNAYTRFKLAITEDAPLVKPYDEAAWATLADSRVTPVNTSLCLLTCLHERWVNLLRAMTEADFQRQYRHPDLAEPRSLEFLLAIYAWHGPHHVAHITELKKQMGW
jgi:hypothetical protein